MRSNVGVERQKARDGIAVVIAVLDDRCALTRTLEALAAQTQLPDEVIVVDGGSVDGTVQLAAGWQDPRLAVRVVSAPGTSIGAARNVGVGAARHTWIACTDAGCSALPGWLAAIDGRRRDCDVVAGVVEVHARNPLQRVLAVTHYPQPGELDERRRWVKASHRIFGRGYAVDRVGGGSMAFSTAAWRAAGGLPEDHAAGEDRGFLIAVIAAGLRTVRAREAAVLWEPPPTWWGNARQFHRYARGDVRLRGRGRHVMRACAWICAPVAALRGGARTRVACVAGGLTYLALPIRRSWDAGLPVSEWWWRMPLVVALKDIAQLTGAAAGVLDAMRAGPAAHGASATPAARRVPRPFRAGRGEPAQTTSA